jgi:hypothetical protein
MDTPDSVRAWIVFDYERDMFERMLELCGNQYSFSRPINNAIVESLLLHVRNLCDILLSRGTESDEITLKNLLPSFNSTKLDELKNLYGSGKKIDSPCWTINKRLAHSTLVRSESFDYSPLLRQLTSCLRSLFIEVQEARGMLSL